MNSTAARPDHSKANHEEFLYTELHSADLLVGAIYRGGRKGNSGDDPLNALLNVSLMGGFRYRGSPY